MLTQKTTSTSGFTLIELMVVIAIIGILASIILANLSDTQGQARDSIRLSDMRSISTALELFYNDNGRYPNLTEDGISTSGEFIGVGDDIDTALAPYLNPIPRDPLHDGTLYFYSYDSLHYVDMDCSLPSADTGMVYGFNYAEQIGGVDGIVSQETCLGGDMNLDDAAYNRAVIRSSY